MTQSSASEAHFLMAVRKMQSVSWEIRARKTEAHPHMGKGIL